MRSVFHLVPLALLLAACATNNVDTSLLDSVTDEDDITSAREDFAEKIEELTISGGLAADPQLAERVRQIGGKLVSAAVIEWPHAENWEWSIALVDGLDTTFPLESVGGYMFMDAEDVESITPTDDELAFWIALYIVISATSYSDAYVGFEGLRWLGLIALNVALGPAGALASGIVYETHLIRLYRRAILLEMDKIGARLSLAAGYDPGAAVSLLDKSVAWLEQDEENRGVMDDLDWFLVGDYVTEERYANFNRLLTEFAELTPGVQPAPHLVRVIYDSSE